MSGGKRFTLKLGRPRLATSTTASDYNKHAKSTADFVTPIPSPSDSEDPALHGDMIREQIHATLFEGTLDLLAVICKINQFGDGNSLAISVMTFLQHNGTAEEFIARMLQSRIESSGLVESKDLTNILRDNSMTVMLLTMYSKLEGTTYLREVLSKPVDEIVPFSEKLELTPTALAGGEEEAKENVEHCIRAVDLVLQSIIEHQQTIPAPFIRVCHLLDRECRKRLKSETTYPDEQIDACCLRLIGSFIFLRYFCPAITAPNQFGISSQTSFSAEQRKGFILLAKIFIGLGADNQLASKEGSMALLSEQLNQQKETTRKYLHHLSTVEPIASHPVELKTLQLQILMEPVILFLKKNMKKIEDLIKDRQDLTFQLEEIKSLLDNLDAASAPLASSSAPDQRHSIPRVNTAVALGRPSTSTSEKKKTKAERRQSEMPKTDKPSLVESFLGVFRKSNLKSRASSMENLK